MRRRFLESPLWRERFRRLFVSLADGWGCFYASAEVERGWMWDRGKLWADSDTEDIIAPLRLGEWFGLPPCRVWWSYYGRAYVDLVSGQLSRDRTVETSRGLLYEIADDPADRETLSSLQEVSWVSDDLMYRFSKDGSAIAPARTIPTLSGALPPSPGPEDPAWARIGSGLAGRRVSPHAESAPFAAPSGPAWDLWPRRLVSKERIGCLAGLPNDI